ncbi:uncharacterized protein LOC143067021 [Mytilus galloprovincialis]|uniref:uncharacterized protein LOC143067021 n=1 Tax=Mytilus galloprovincialis TaxID=29158 RepID=UPI003F7BE49C
MEFIPGLEENTNKGGELPCDIDNVTTISFTPTTSKSEIRKEDIADFGDEGFLLYDVLSREESNLIISEGEKIGFERMKGVKDEYRSAQRITLNNPDVAQILWDRIKDYLKPIEFTETKDPKSQHIHGIPFLLKGKWEPYGLNNIFRLCRYYPGGHFAPHYDGFYAKSSNERSLKTFMLYLNNEFQDGCTQFVNENQTLYKDANGKYCAEDKNILERIHPHPGMALLFNHQRLHEGQKVRDGTKYILRTDIMYQRCGDKTMDDSEEKALQLLQEAERLEGMGDCMKAAEFYRKAFKLSPALENCH